jgi:cytoskeleton protein RodZ
VALKVPVRKLEALESDRLDLLPDAVFARALAGSVCRNLKIDPGPILALLPVQVMPNLELDTGTTDRTNMDLPRSLWHAPMLSRIPRAVVGLAVALVLAAVVLLVMPDLPLRSPDPVAAEAVPVGALPAGASSASPAPPGGVVEPVGQGAGVGADAPAGATAATGSTVPTTPVIQALAASAPAPVPPAQTGLPALGLRARGPSWVEVTDATGAVQLRKTLNAGESVAVSGALPLSVIVGRADAIDVQVRGQAFELRPLAKDNVARFQVK